ILNHYAGCAKKPNLWISLFTRICQRGNRSPAARDSAVDKVFREKIWSGKRDSNSRPRPWQGRALPTELFPLGWCVAVKANQILERETRLELATPTLARSCSTN